MILELLDEVNKRLAEHQYTKPLQHCYSVSGDRVKSLLGIHQKCCVLIASPYSQFKGIKGIQQFGSQARPSIPVENIKPAPTTWIQNATVRWLNTNETVDIPNTGSQCSVFQASDHDERLSQLHKASVAESLRNEHTKVHEED